MPWHDACAMEDIEEEDLIRFDHGGKTYAIYRSPDDEYFCTDGLCTHEQVHLDGVGLVQRLVGLEDKERAVLVVALALVDAQGHREPRGA